MLCCGWTVYVPSPADAGGAPQPRTVHALDTYPYLLRNEAWGGTDIVSTSWSVYSGSTYALTGDIEQPGWRLRSTGGYGRYTYRKWRLGLDGKERVNLRYTARKYFSDLLVGYHFQWRRLTLKTFGGLTTERHVITPHDPDKSVTVMSYGGKAALNAWLSLSNRRWLATRISWASTVNTYKISTQAGHAVLDDLDLGIEAKLDGNDRYRTGRIGSFVTWRIGDAGLTIAADTSVDRSIHAVPYGSINLFMRY